MDNKSLDIDVAETQIFNGENKEEENTRIQNWEVELPKLKEENFTEDGKFNSFKYSKQNTLNQLFAYCKILQLTLNNKIMLGQDKENPLTEEEIMKFYKIQEQTFIKLCETFSLLEILEKKPEWVQPAVDEEGKEIIGQVQLNPKSMEQLGGLHDIGEGKKSVNWKYLEEKTKEFIDEKNKVESIATIGDENLKKNLESLKEEDEPNLSDNE